jgi:hypothetical protein
VKEERLKNVKGLLVQAFQEMEEHLCHQQALARIAAESRSHGEWLCDLDKRLRLYAMLTQPREASEKGDEEEDGDVLMQIRSERGEEKEGTAGAGLGAGEEEALGTHLEEMLLEAEEFLSSQLDPKKKGSNRGRWATAVQSNHEVSLAARRPTAIDRPTSPLSAQRLREGERILAPGTAIQQLLSPPAQCELENKHTQNML